MRKVEYAGFWLRVIAGIIDGIVLNVVLYPLNLWPQQSGKLLILAQVILSWVYFAGMESSSWQATIGKKALGLKVTDLQYKRISFLRATGREFGKYLSMLILGIGFLMIAFTEKKQGLHDKLSDCLVVKAA